MKKRRRKQKSRDLFYDDSSSSSASSSCSSELKMASFFFFLPPPWPLKRRRCRLLSIVFVIRGSSQTFSSSSSFLLIGSLGSPWWFLLGDCQAPQPLYFMHVYASLNRLILHHPSPLTTGDDVFRRIYVYYWILLNDDAARLLFSPARNRQEWSFHCMTLLSAVVVGKQRGISASATDVVKKSSQ